VTSTDSVSGVRALVAEARARGRRIALVPTMGYLHDGHLALCDKARHVADTVVVSIYVNPLQFGTGEDLERYPRDFERDATLAADRGVDILFAPTDTEVYPDGLAAVRVTAPTLADRLCGRYRPGHFDGVLTVVAKLLNMIRPDSAVFGQKDLQQLVLIRRMVRDLDFATAIIGVPIVREPDGLAMSSRNVYLDADARHAATALSRALSSAQDVFTDGAREADTVTDAARSILEATPGVTVQYVELVDTLTLDTPAQARRGDAVAIAAFVGGTRLIDNHMLG
jgi:pantoate--beta-alanine ligase